ncbi:MAG: hypothetical protein AAGB93_10845 [Planctomycetota bacterium]
MKVTALLFTSVAIVASAGPLDRSEKLADAYVDAVERVNASHARKPGDTTEADLAKTLPRKALRALDDLLELERGDSLDDSLARCARAALDLDRVDDFVRCRDALAARDAGAARELGAAFSSDRALVLGSGGLDEAYLEHFAEVVEDIFDAYDELFGFEEFSKVPGKKIRFRVHLEDEIVRPPHFAPQFPWHSEVDFPVVDSERLRSPTSDGKFLFYGLCHELGHAIAMWGDRSNEEDHHAWGHYTGVVLVEHIAGSKRPPEWLADCRDVRWRSPAKELERLGETPPSAADRDGVLALLFALHEEVGPGAIGDAINALDREDDRLRINRVRYYTLKQLEDALTDGVKKKAQRRRIAEIFAD